MSLGVLVLGMGSSGTSALTRAFACAGFYAGDENHLLGPSRHNPLGHYERHDVIATNLELLSFLGCSWADPPTREEQLRSAPELRPRVERLLDAISREAAGRPIALKDPRIGWLAHIWLPVTKARLHSVLALRNPVEIARSLATRHGLPLPVGLAMWELNMGNLLDALAGQPVSIVHYGALVADPQTLVHVIEETRRMLGPARQAAVRPNDAPKAIAVELRRERAEPQELRAHLTKRQMALHSYLSGLPGGRAILDPPSSLRGRSDEAAATVLRARLRAIESSTSWRLTRPLRWLGDIRRKPHAR